MPQTGKREFSKAQSYWCLAANIVVLTEAILQVERAPFLNGPLWTNVTVVSAKITNGGGLIVPDDRQTLVYDLDGNLTFDGTWSYEWDGENRLKLMTMTNVTTSKGSAVETSSIRGWAQSAAVISGTGPTTGAPVCDRLKSFITVTEWR